VEITPAARNGCMAIAIVLTFQEVVVAMKRVAPSRGYPVWIDCRQGKEGLDGTLLSSIPVFLMETSPGFPGREIRIKKET
jgi:hypothetical protein